MFVYQPPPGLQFAPQAAPSCIRTPQGGKVWIDTKVSTLLEFARGKTFQEILRTFPPSDSSKKEISAALVCLAEAGFLLRGEGEITAALKKVTGPKVSAILVGFNSRKWLEECLPSLLAQNYGPLEIILVDNGSRDGTSQWLPDHFPSIKLFTFPQSRSLARAINQGISLSEGEFFLVLNPDVRLEKDALAQMVAVAAEGEDTAAVAAKLKFWWAPAFLNGLGNYVGAFSWGTDWGLGHLDLGQFDQVPEVPSACFAAALIPRPSWEKIGPLDEGFPLYYEDVEWCYRARLMGFKIRPAAQATIYHALGGRVPEGTGVLRPDKLTHVAYGRMRFALKLLQGARSRFLRNYVLEDGINILRYLAVGRPSLARAYVKAWERLKADWPEILQSRRAFQPLRNQSDESLFSLQTNPPPNLTRKGFPELTWGLIARHYAPLLFERRTRAIPEMDLFNTSPHLLIISSDRIDSRMAGPGLRYWEMARALGRRDIEVTVAVPFETTLQDPTLRLVPYQDERPETLQGLVDNSDVVLISGNQIQKFPFLKKSSTRLVVDFYDPMVLENLHYYLEEPIPFQKALNQQAIQIACELAQAGDFFICGNERQRDYWLGLLTANRRVNPLTFNQDNSLRTLIEVVGVGFPDHEPVHFPVLKGVHPLVPEDARIVLWGGGIWNWLDPLTLIKAWPQVLMNHPQARLIFLGTRHPNPLVPRHEMAAKAEGLAAEIGEKDKTIIFFEWLPFRDREAFLCESQVGVTLHPVHLETRYSIRTRVLDYIWARLPILITEGDITSEWVVQYQLGRVVPPFDSQAVGRALSDLLSEPREERARFFDPLHQRLHWSSVVEPLRRYCLEGGYAPDRGNLPTTVSPKKNLVTSYLARAYYLGRREGLGTAAHRAWRTIQRRLAGFNH